MERVNRQLAETVRALLVLWRQDDGSYKLSQNVPAEALLNVAHDACKDELSFTENAGELIWDIARHQGYIIPACPIEARGDAHAFLIEQGVTNADEWYRKRGFSDQQMRSLYTTSAFMARNQQFWRRIIPIPKLAARDASGIAPYVIQALDFCLGTSTPETDPAVFLC